MKTAFLFPGQGVDIARIGPDLWTCLPRVRKCLDYAVERLQMERDSLWSRGGRALERTDIFQPVLTALTLGLFEELRHGAVAPDVVAGHSLGEIAAYAASGAISAEDAIEVARVRGHEMAREAGSRPGGMLALTGNDVFRLDQALAAGRCCGRVQVAAWNAPEECILSGETSALHAINRMCPTAIRLPVFGQWHGPAMRGAIEELRVALARTDCRSLRAVFISNRTGDVVADGSRIPELLVQQLIHPVNWIGTMATLRRLGVTDIITVGPGRILRNLAHKNALNDVRIHATERTRDLACTLEHYETPFYK